MAYFKNQRLSITKSLTRANIMENQAEAIAEQILENSGEISKDYIDIKFNEIISITEARIECMRADLLKWFIGIIGAQTTAIIISIFLSK